jgi:CheY-like chemotaxis protein
MAQRNNRRRCHGGIACEAIRTECTGHFRKHTARFSCNFSYAIAHTLRGLHLKQRMRGATSRRWSNQAGSRCQNTRLRQAQYKQRGVRIRTVSNIVIYEEDGPMRALLKEWLGEVGYHVRGAVEPTGPLAEEADLVIVSVYMPKHAGMQRVRDVRASHTRTPLIAISSQFRSGLSTAGATAQLLGVDQVIAKPLARETLLDAVRDIIGPPS